MPLGAHKASNPGRDGAKIPKPWKKLGSIHAYETPESPHRIRCLRKGLWVADQAGSALGEVFIMSFFPTWLFWCVRRGESPSTTQSPSTMRQESIGNYQDNVGFLMLERKWFI